MASNPETEDRLKSALRDRYRIERKIGAGGMATVYLARDVKHHRQVAVKVLRPELSAIVGTERFLAEIETTANLQHPNILPLFDSGEADGLLFFVMPFVEGESLRERLDREKQLPVEEAVRFAIEIADALGAAHEHGVIHRDIKPANVLLSRGRPLVTDFGIALALSASAGDRLTETGLSVGTPHYMSPEQATGDQATGPATDIYSLACMLYEMLAGEPPYSGNTVQAILGKIIAGDLASVTALRKSVPPNVDAAISRALENLPADRFATAGEFSDALKNPGFSGHPTTAPIPSPLSRELKWRRVALSLASVAVLLAIFSAWGWMRSESAAVTKVAMVWPEGMFPISAEGGLFSLSPDGSHVVYVGADRQLWVRDLSDLTPRLLSGTADAIDPFFSPDGEFIAFVTGSRRALKVTPSAGGAVQTLVADSADFFGGDWGPDGMLYFTGVGGEVKRVAAVGGPVETVSQLDSDRGDLKHDWVDVLPSGKGALVSIWAGSANASEIGLLDLATGEVTALFPGARARYSASGHIVFAMADGTLYAVPFDQNRLVLTGSPVQVLEDLEVRRYSGGGRFAVSENGTLAYWANRESSVQQAVWVTKEGTETPLVPEWRANFFSLALSPDGRRIAATLQDKNRQDIWVRRLDTGTLNRLTFDGQGSLNYRAKWTPDGESVIYISDRSGTADLWLQRADGGTPAESLLSDGPLIDEGFLSPDGRWLVYRTGGSNVGARDIRGMRTGNNSEPMPLVATSSDEYSPALDPNSRWLAYVSDESGRPEVYVRPFPVTEGVQWQVSSAGARSPVWDRTGRQLFFQAASGELMAVAVVADTTFAWGSPRVLFDASGYVMNVWHPSYDVSPDGERFLMVRNLEDEYDEFVLVLNWFTELKEQLKR